MADGLTVAVVGASGNLGTSVVAALSTDPRIGRVIGLARRTPTWSPPRTTWVRADIRTEPQLAELFRSVDVIVPLAWMFQPTRHPEVTWETNVLGSIRVFEAAAEAQTPAVVYVSSVGAYSPGPKDRAVDESWPTHGWPAAAYCREKAYLERYLDTYERRFPWVRMVRVRPGFLFKREAASEQRRIFAGQLLPRAWFQPERLPVLPELPGMRLQALHTADAADGVRLAVTSPVRGAFNLATDPVLDAGVLAELLGVRTMRVPASVVRPGLSAAWHARLLPASPQLFDAALHMPLLDSARAREELDWRPRHRATEAVQEFLTGVRGREGMETPPLAARP
ncbi:NAD-dependent epimerase [Streptomyces oceani]|uniref:NAD-dependent epimerase n=1 Tax=Streptomyces oceani TaxID=1075402 RepID=A0A1E7KH73_9ACTN|nr:NAD-dependent epimerase [Streptomyces oceani]